jgi:hypothetical protein
MRSGRRRSCSTIQAASIASWLPRWDIVYWFSFPVFFVRSTAVCLSVHCLIAAFTGKWSLVVFLSWR